MSANNYQFNKHGRQQNKDNTPDNYFKLNKMSC